MKKSRKKKFHLKHILLFILVIIASFGVGTLAKYVLEEFHSYYINSKYFYFTSNRLKENNPLYQVNNWSGVGSFTISFDLLSEKNSLVYNDYDVPYTVSYTCPANVICSLDKESGTIYNTSETHSDTVVLSVNPQRTFTENESITIHLEAYSTAPYNKTISADFQYIVGKSGVTYEIEDEANRAYLILKITNAISYCTVVTAFDTYSVGDTIDNKIYRTLSDTNKAKCISQNITLNFNPNNLLIDTTNDITNTGSYSTTTIDGISYINQLSFPIIPVSTTAIKFYKTDTTANYTYPLENSTSIITVNIADPI